MFSVLMGLVRTYLHNFSEGDYDTVYCPVLGHRSTQQ